MAAFIYFLTDPHALPSLTLGILFFKNDLVELVTSHKQLLSTQNKYRCKE